MVDASAMLAFCFLDERPSQPEAVLRRLRSDGLLAPSHWPLELTNTLEMAVRRKRISAAQRNEFLELVLALDVVIDPETATHAWAETRLLAEALALTTYDAAYLELALRTGAALATKDAALGAAAQGLNVSLFDLA
ncbi:PIN domain-containing protein [bacterium]|nr:PIN domain-containing protein [bacterium]